MKFMDTHHTCTIYIGLGQGDSEYIDIEQSPAIMEGIQIQARLAEAFGRAGFANRTYGKQKLLPCSVGTFVNSSVSDPNELKCVECPAGGFYSDTEAFASDSCLRCPNGTFVHFNNAPGVRKSDCIACPQGTDTNEFAGYRACKCLTNFYRTHLFEDCKPCDQPGLQCVHDFATLRSGYWWKWRNETDKMIYKTFTEGLKNAGVTPAVRTKTIASEGSYIEYPYSLPQPQKCPREKSCIGGLVSLCALGYEGPLCEICSKGFHKQLKSCNKCPTKKWMIGQLSVLAAVILLIIVIVVWTSRKKGKKNEERSSVDIILGRLKIAIGFYQVTSGVLEAFSYIKWPDSLTQIGEYSEVLQGNVFQIAPIQCLFENLKVNAFGSLYAILALNATAIIVAAAVYGIKKLTLMRNTLSEEVKVKEMSQTKEVIYRNLFFFLHVTYLSTCLKTANVLPLACHTICVDEEDEACEKFLKADYSIDCTSSEFNRSVFVAYCTVAYIVFLPTSFFIILCRQRSYQKQERGLSTSVSLQSREVLTGLRFLFENYTEQTWYWELVETIRKVVLTSGLILVGSESRAYVGLACVISGLYGMFFAYKRPILDSFENKLMLSSLGVTFVNLGIGAVSRIPKEGLPSSINPYLDNIIFNVLVFGANSLVIGLLLVQYLTNVYGYLNTWRKNPQWSFSCCLALLLPLNELQGDVQGLSGKSLFQQQLQTGKMDMPTMSGALKDSGTINFSLEEDEEKQQGGEKNHESKLRPFKGIENVQDDIALTEVTIHETTAGKYDTAL